MPTKPVCRCGHELHIPKTLGENQRLTCSECGRVIRVLRKTTKAEHSTEDGDDDWLDGLSEAEGRGQIVAVQKWKCVKCGKVVVVSDDEPSPESCDDCQGVLKPLQKGAPAHEVARTKRQARRERQRTRAGWETVRRGLNVMYFSSMALFFVLLVALALSSAVLGFVVYAYFARHVGPLLAAIPTLMLACLVLLLLLAGARLVAEEYFWDAVGFIGANVFFVMCLMFYPWIAGPTLVLLLVLVPLISLALLTGFGMCCAAPSESSSRIWIASSTGCLLAAVSLFITAQAMAAKPLSGGKLQEALALPLFLYLTKGAELSGFVGHLSFAFFLRDIGAFFKDRYLPEIAIKYIVFQVATFTISSMLGASIVFEKKPDPWLILTVFGFHLIQSVITVGWFMYLTRSTADCIES